MPNDIKVNSIIFVLKLADKTLEDNKAFVL